MEGKSGNHKKDFYKYLGEASLIIFSVLLALLLNEYRENLKQKDLAEKNLRSIKNEIAVNLSIIEEWIPYHKEVIKNIDQTINNDSLKSSLVTTQGFNIFQIAPNGVFQRNLDQTAWYMSQQNGTVSSLDYETMYLLSRLYDLQENSVKPSLQEILKVLFSKESLQKENINETLTLLYTRFKVLSELELALKNSYVNSLRDLNGNLN